LLLKELSKMEIIFFEETKMIYITVIAQGVPKQSQKDHSQYKLQAKSVDTHTNKRIRPSSVSTKTKNHITSLQPPQRI